MTLDNDIQTDKKKREFKCEFCNKNLASKFSLERHKMVCKKREIKTENVHQFLENVHRNLENVNQNLENVNLQSNKCYNCKKCNKGYSTMKYLNDHEKKCKGLSILTCPKCMITFSSRFSKSNHIKRNNCKPRSIVFANTPQTNNNITINNTININNKIIINNYGNERTDYITFDDMIRILKDSGSSIIPKYIQMKHFNKNFPENNNIKYDVRNGCLIKKGDEWRSIGIDNISRRLIDHNSGEIGIFYNKNKDDINKIFKDIQFLEYVTSRFNYLDLHLDKKFFNDLKNEIKYIIKSNVLK